MMNEASIGPHPELLNRNAISAPEPGHRFGMGNHQVREAPREFVSNCLTSRGRSRRFRDNDRMDDLPMLTPATWDRLNAVFARENQLAAAWALSRECGNNIPGCGQFTLEELE